MNTVEVYLNKKEDFYNKFSKEKINDKLSNYIYNEALEGNIKDNVVINITNKEVISNIEKEKMMDIIRKNYGIKVKDLLYTYEKEQNKKAILLVIGIFLILIYYTGLVSILKEVILLVGWISICASVYGLIFSSTSTYVQITRLKNLAKSRIYFNQVKKYKIVKK